MKHLLDEMTRLRMLAATSGGGSGISAYDSLGGGGGGGVDTEGLNNLLSSFNKVRDLAMSITKFMETEANFGLQDDTLAKLDTVAIAQLEEYETKLRIVCVCECE